MLKKTVKYEDFDGNLRTEVLHFNLNRVELMDVAMNLPGKVTTSLAEDVNEIDETEAVSRMFGALGNKGIYEFIKMLVEKSYGVKSADGRKLEKSEELLEDFKQTLAYEAVIMELIGGDGTAASTFINNVLPKDVMENMIKNQRGNAVVPKV